MTDISGFDALQELLSLRTFCDEFKKNRDAIAQAAANARRHAGSLRLERPSAALLRAAEGMEEMGARLGDFLNIVEGENRNVKAALEKAIIVQADLDKINADRQKAARDAEARRNGGQGSASSTTTSTFIGYHTT